jgi:hypothetical protein
MHVSCIGGKRQVGLSQDRLEKGSINSSSSEPGFFGSMRIGVFDAAPPNLAVALSQAGEERLFWELAGARGIASLTAPPPAG